MIFQEISLSCDVNKQLLCQKSPQTLTCSLLKFRSKDPVEGVGFRVSVQLAWDSIFYGLMHLSDYTESFVHPRGTESSTNDHVTSSQASSQRVLGTVMGGYFPKIIVVIPSTETLHSFYAGTLDPMGLSMIPSSPRTPSHQVQQPQSLGFRGSRQILNPKP